ncbi:hypothetical protein [Variovorax sp. E3]|uniref:hypothetical protein n=1 Tax=Variovorax sp. E3 TaxID=1914993 RepID=UPI0018DDBF17|nr:hypothetical protein [Variovorax sp. E3]
MRSKKHNTAWRTCGIALAVACLSAHAEPDTAAPAAAAAPAAPAATEAPAAESGKPALPAQQTRVRFERGFYKPGYERLRVIRRDSTIGNIAGQVALSVAVSLFTGNVNVAAQGFSKDQLAGDTLDEFANDPASVNPAISELNDTLSKLATEIYRKRAEAAYATALTDGSTPEEIEEARQQPKEADTPLYPGPWHLVYENLAGTDELFRLKFGAELGRPGFMRPPAACYYQSEPVAWAQWKADNWQLLRDERAKAVASCTEALAAIPEKRW